jgi:hypothetical protein
MTLIIILGLLALIALVGFLWRDQVKHRRRVAAQRPMKHTRCGTPIITSALDKGETVIVNLIYEDHEITEEYFLDEDGVLKVRILTEET